MKTIFLLDAKIQSFHIKQRPFTIQVYFPNTESVLIAGTNEQEKDEWIKALKDIVSTLKSSSSEAVETRLSKSGAKLDPNDVDWSAGVTLGKGGSGLVRKGIWLKTVDVAIKTLNNMPDFIDKDEQTQFYKEIQILAELRHVSNECCDRNRGKRLKKKKENTHTHTHTQMTLSPFAHTQPNVVSMFGYCIKESYLCLITEYVRGGDVSSVVRDTSLGQFSMRLKVTVALNMAGGMTYLHGKGE
jgi:hypothetical protein